MRKSCFRGFSHFITLVDGKVITVSAIKSSDKNCNYFSTNQILKMSSFQQKTVGYTKNPESMACTQKKQSIGTTPNYVLTLDL